MGGQVKFDSISAFGACFFKAGGDRGFPAAWGHAAYNGELPVASSQIPELEMGGFVHRLLTSATTLEGRVPSPGVVLGFGILV